MTREEIKNNLDDGDGIKITRRCEAKGVVTTARYVNEVLRGRCTGEKGKAKVILEVAEEIALENIRDKELAKNNIKINQ